MFLFYRPSGALWIGVAIPYAPGKRLSRGDSRARIYGHLVFRVAVMIVLGMRSTATC